MKNAITAHATKNAATNPTAVAIHCCCVSAAPCFRRLYAEAANMVGIARKKEYSTATCREVPSISEPRIVDAEREVPGIIARHCTMPIRNARLKLSSSVLETMMVRLNDSIQSSATQPPNSAIATGREL